MSGILLVRAAWIVDPRWICGNSTPGRALGLHCCRHAAPGHSDFAPIERAYALILELSALIALHVGAYG